MRKKKRRLNTKAPRYKGKTGKKIFSRKELKEKRANFVTFLYLPPTPTPTKEKWG